MTIGEWNQQFGERLAAATPAERALLFAAEFAHYDGDHHKQWVIDQMVRALTDCPLEVHRRDGDPYTYRDQGESDAYRAFVASWESDRAFVPASEADRLDPDPGWSPTWRTGTAV
jgi:hypothetical protein